MNCPSCNRPTNEPGDCKRCLPFNIYLIAIPLDWESVKQWTVENQDQISPLCCQVDFDHEQGSFDSALSAKVAVIRADIDGVSVVIVPHIDRLGNPSVAVVQ